MAIKNPVDILRDLIVHTKLYQILGTPEIEEESFELAREVMDAPAVNPYDNNRDTWKQNRINILMTKVQEYNYGKITEDSRSHHHF